MSALLGWAARHGAWIVLFGVALGLAAPALADVARPGLTAAIFVFTFGSLMKYDASAFRGELLQARRNAALVAWATFGVPVATAAVVALAHPGPGLTQGLLFWAVVPSSGACVAFSVVLGRPAAAALLATVVGTMLAPLALPAMVAAFGGAGPSGDPVALVLRLLAVIGGACVAAVLVRRYAGGFVRARPEALTGLAVVALFVAGLGSMRGMQSALRASPVQAFELLALAAAAYALAWGAGAMLFRRCGADAAWSAGLVGSTRTITLAWVVLGDALLPEANVFLGCAMIVKYTAPAVLRLLQSAPSARSAGDEGRPWLAATSWIVGMVLGVAALAALLGVGPGFDGAVVAGRQVAELR